MNLDKSSALGYRRMRVEESKTAHYARDGSYG